MEKVPHINLVICTPGHSVMASYMQSLLRTTSELSARGITWTWANGYSSHVADAREITLSGTYQNNPAEVRPLEGNVTYDKLIWIDSDIAWEPEDLIKLYESDKDIVSGAYLLATGEVTAYKEALKSPYYYDEVIKMKEPVVVHSVGFGFICIKQGIFESMTRPWFQSVFITHPFEGKEYTFPIMGEDMSWCHRVQQLGYEVWFDPTVRVTHHKTMKLTWEGVKP